MKKNFENELKSVKVKLGFERLTSEEINKCLDFEYNLKTNNVKEEDWDEDCNYNEVINEIDRIAEEYTKIFTNNFDKKSMTMDEVYNFKTGNDISQTSYDYAIINGFEF